MYALWDRGDLYRNDYLRHEAEHVLTFASTRSGKGVGLVVPTLLHLAPLSSPPTTPNASPSSDGHCQFDS
ncbi:type IV secretory system conjugative DNA transfer family protein [Streptomyces noursei]|uniref:type IV secretory system conjugative DNA transfer family protein n=1 Tax=Streptomyces noursei TaxID=1971 RepID=UPI003F540CC9